MKDGKFITMGIESSCDETSVAILADERELLSNVIASQIAVHRVYGGVVPEIASRHHLTNFNRVYQEALDGAGITLDDVDLIGVTCGPGLVGALLMGLASAKALAFAGKKPLVGVHHIQGHISANYLEYPDLKPPFLALVVSGGHTHIIDVKGYTEYEVLGRTRDDAAGEAFDKVARVLGLGYPGGPLIDNLAKEGNPEAVDFKRVYLEKDSLDFSFSGTKTGVLNYLNQKKLKGEAVCAADVAAGFQAAVVEVIVKKAVMAAERTGRKQLALAGGVAANSCLREQLGRACSKAGIALYRPSPILCTDNGGMIAVAAYRRFQAGIADDLYLDADPSLPIEI